jgi:hypothetical protein
MEMLKMFEVKGKMHLTKQKFFKLIRGVRNGDFASSSIQTNENLRQFNTFNPQAKIFAKQRRLEIELQKTLVISTARAMRAREGH